ncbi:MAG: LLM class flavin-dependent oxidoreductase [Chloroflexota bacterium]
MSSQISIAFQTDKPIAAYGPLAKTVEEYGFSTVSVYNDMLYQPAWLPLMEMAHATERIEIGVAAVNPFTCHPINIASNIALIDEASQGRAYLGLARGGWLDYVGLHPQRPIAALKEAFGSIHHLLAQKTEPFVANQFPLAGGEALRWQILRTDIPLLLGTWGPKTIHACIEHINAVKIGGTANPDVVPYLKQAIDDAAGKANRPAAKIQLVIGAVTVVDEDGDAARQLAKREVALYLPIIAQLDQSLDIEPDRLERINAAAESFDFERAARDVSDELLAKLAFVGTPSEVAAQAVALFEAGTERVEFGTPHGLSTQGGLRLLGEKVLPILKPYLEGQ